MVRRALLLLGATIALAACSSLIETFTPPAAVGGGEAAAQAASGTTVALLAPLTGANAERGPALVQAAQLALAAPGSPHLDVQDTGSTAAGAAAAAQAAIAARARLIIGPLTGAETAAVAGPARAAGVPVLAFTNDVSQAQPGVWVLGITPAQQMRRLVGTLLEHGQDAASRRCCRRASSAPRWAMRCARRWRRPVRRRRKSEIHDGTNGGIQRSLRALSHYSERRGPIEDEDPAGAREARRRRAQGSGGAGEDADPAGAVRRAAAGRYRRTAGLGGELLELL